MPSNASVMQAAAKQVAIDAKRENIMAAELARHRSTPTPTSLTPESISEAWSLISPAGHSVLTKSQLMDSLKMFFPHMTAKDVRDLVGTGNMSVDKLTHLLLNSDVPHVDANAEAFKILDPTGSGLIEPNVIKKLLTQIHGVDQIDEADMQLILQLCDADGDGKISLKDFASIGSWAPVKEAPTEFTRKLMLEKLKQAQGINRDD